MHYTIGNNQPGPSNPTHASQLISHAGLDKFTAHGAVADTETSLAFDIAFPNFYIIRQTQKGGGKNGVKHGFVNGAGHYVGVVGSDQDAPCMITRAQADAAGGVRWQAEYLKAGDYTFQGGAG
jgi:hypothetical protein